VHNYKATGLETPQIRNQAPRFEQMMVSKDSDMEMITSAMPDRRSSHMFHNEMNTGFNGTVMPKIEASAPRRGVPSYGFDDRSNFNNENHNFV
jgi:hypothetical protein